MPQIICYKGSNISYQIAKKLIKIKFIGLVNLIMNKEVVKELIQHQLTTQNLHKELTLLLEDGTKLQQLKSDYASLWQLLKQGGNASEKAAHSIYTFMYPTA